MNNNKVCVNLIVPSLEETYNVFLPISKQTLEVIYLLAKALHDLSGGTFPVSNHLSLINALNGSIYDTNLTVLENKILNGSKIILI